MTDVALKQADQKFRAYPGGKVLGVIDNPQQLEATLKALKDAGIEPCDIETFFGQDGIEKLDCSGKHHGFVGRLRRLAHSLGEEGATLRQYETALEAGHFLISVAVGDSQDTKHKACDVLRAHGAHYLHYYGRSLVEDI